MLEEPQRHDSALHPLLEARRAVLQDLAEHPVTSSTSRGRAGPSSAGDHSLEVAGRAESALDTLSAARATVGSKLHGQRAAAYPPDFDDSPRSRASPRLSAEASRTGALYSQSSLTSGFGPPILDNPPHTLEEARRLMGLGDQAGPSSSSWDHAGPSTAAPLGLTRTTSKTLEEARRLLLGLQECSSAGPSHAGQGYYDELSSYLHRDSAQHPLVQARRAVLDDFTSSSAE